MRNERQKRHLKPGNTSNTRKRGISARSYYVLALKYIEFNGNERRACIEAGFAPSYATELFRNEKVKALIEQLRPKYEKELIRQMVEQRLLTRDFLDLHLMHIIANGETHHTRGDADRVKGIEIGYKALGVIQPVRVVANAQAVALAGAPKPTTMYEVYKSRWLIGERRKDAAAV